MIEGEARTKRRLQNLVLGSCLFLASLVALALALFPMYVIRPFREQKPAALQHALWVTLHDKPIFLVDIAGYWQPLRALLDHIVARRFAASLVPRLVEIVPTVSALMVALAPPAPGRKTGSDLA